MTLNGIMVIIVLYFAIFGSLVVLGYNYVIVTKVRPVLSTTNVVQYIEFSF